MCEDREAVQKLEAKVRSERTTCGETVSGHSAVTCMYNVQIPVFMWKVIFVGIV